MPSTLFDTTEPRSVMTYNLKNGGNRLHWLVRRRKLVRVIRNVRPTLLGTQEGYRTQLDYIRKRLPGYDYVGGGRFADDSDEFNAIFYDTRILSPVGSGTWWLATAHDEPGSIVDGENLPRIASWARFTVLNHDREIVMVNTHLTYQDIGRQVQVESLIAGIHRVTTADDDVLLTGDFNQPPHSPTWSSVTAAGFVDALDFAERCEGPDFTDSTWRRWSPEEAREATEPKRIDWILYRPGTGRDLPQGLTLRTLNTHTHMNPPSDHFPVILTNQR